MRDGNENINRPSCLHHCPSIGIPSLRPGQGGHEEETTWCHSFRAPHPSPHLTSPGQSPCPHYLLRWAQIMSCSQCYPFVIYRLIWRLLALLRPMQPAHCRLHSARPRSKDNHHKECNLTLVYCSLFVCASLSSTKHRACRTSLLQATLVCMYRAPSSVTHRYREVLFN